MYQDFKAEIKLLFIVAIVAVIIAVAGIFLLKITQPPVVQISPSPQSQTENLDTSGSAMSGVEGWQTYRNDELGFEVQTGSNCHSVNHNTTTTFFNEIIIPAEESGSGEDASLPWNEVSISVYSNLNDLANTQESTSLEDFLKREYGHFIDLKPEKIEKATLGIGEYEGWLVDIFKEVGTIAIMSSVYVERGDGRIFVLNGPTPSLTSAIAVYPEYPCDFDQIISTFRFIESIDTSDWQTYRNDEYGFEMKYPVEFVDWGRSDRGLAVIRRIEGKSRLTVAIRIVLEFDSLEEYLKEVEEVRKFADEGTPSVFVEDEKPDIIVGGKRAFQQEIFGSASALNTIETFIEISPNLIIDVSVRDDDGNPIDDSLRNLNNQILSTLRFVE